MTKVLSVGLIIAVLTLSFNKVCAQRKVPLDKANCFISVPDSVKLHTDTIHTDIGSIIYYTYIGKDSLFQYQLAYCEYPKGTIHSDSTELLKAFFDATITASVEKLNGIQRYASEVVQFGFPGWFWRIDNGSNWFTKTKAFVAGRKFYKLQISGPKQYDQNKITTSFFESFQFMDLNKIRK